MRRSDVLLVGLCLAGALMVGEARAANTCFTYTPGHVYYVAYQQQPTGNEYIVDLGDRSQFVNATTHLTFSQVNPGDFSAIFSPTAPNLFVAVFGVLNPATRDAILSTNGPRNQVQAENSSCIGASQVVDSWATGLAGFSDEVGSMPCHLDAARFSPNDFGSYNASFNGFAPPYGSLGQSVAWNAETRLSNSGGTRTAVPGIRFFTCSQSSGQPPVGAALGYFSLSTSGAIDYYPDADGDGLPNVAIGSDRNADRCPGVNSTNNTDGDNDQHAVPCDCNDADATVWAIPTEVPAGPTAASAVRFPTKTTIAWNAPSEVGAAVPKYDLLRWTQTAMGAVPAWACGQSDLTTLTATESANPLAGKAVFYLVRGVTSCGDGPVGAGRNAPPRTVPTCP